MPPLFPGKRLAIKIGQDENVSLECLTGLS